jgi:structural maintenance of chromosome 3 (chondroitin sulfate proteoglycan 6)
MVFVCFNKQDALPLIHQLQYAQEYDRAMQYVFGRTLLCRNMEAAYHFAEENNLDCVTLDGDQVSIFKSITCVIIVISGSGKTAIFDP